MPDGGDRWGRRRRRGLMKRASQTAAFPSNGAFLSTSITSLCTNGSITAANTVIAVGDKSFVSTHALAQKECLPSPPHPPHYGPQHGPKTSAPPPAEPGSKRACACMTLASPHVSPTFRPSRFHHQRKHADLRKYDVLIDRVAISPPGPAAFFENHPAFGGRLREDGRIDQVEERGEAVD